MVAIVPHKFYEINVPIEGKNVRLPMRIGKPVRPDPVLAFASRLVFEPSRVTDWPELRWQLEQPDGNDFMMTVNSVRLVSPAFRKIVEQHLRPADDVPWIPATIVSADGLEHPYWMPHFPTRLDVLDNELTTWGTSGLPIRAVLAPEKITELSFFPQSGRSLIVNGTLMKALQRAKMTGMVMQRARMRRPDYNACGVPPVPG